MTKKDLVKNGKPGTFSDRESLIDSFEASLEVVEPEIEVDLTSEVAEQEADNHPGIAPAIPSNAATFRGKGGKYRAIGGGLKVPVSE